MLEKQNNNILERLITPLLYTGEIGAILLNFWKAEVEWNNMTALPLSDLFKNKNKDNKNEKL